MRRILTIALGSLLTTSAAGAETQTAFDFYRAYLAQTAQAVSLDEILPLLPDWWAARYAGADEATREAALERVRGTSRMLEDVKLEKEERTAQGTVLDLTARDTNGLPLRGKVIVVEEGGTLRVEESTWGSAQ